MSEARAAGSIESFDLEGPAGRLEAILNLGTPAAKRACLVCHPHPLYGGTMHNKVVFHAMKALNNFGYPVLRFNYRGVGRSQGTHDNGCGEVADTRAALDYMAARFSLPIVFAGFSFGAAIGLRAAVEHPSVESLIAIGAPLNAEGRKYTYEGFAASPLPKLMVSGASDEFSSPAGLAELYESLAQPKQLVMIPEADHFFAGHLESLRVAIATWIDQLA